MFPRSIAYGFLFVAPFWAGVAAVVAATVRF